MSTPPDAVSRPVMLYRRGETGHTRLCGPLTSGA